MIAIIFTTLILIGILMISSVLTNISDIKNNWEAYRCRPDIMATSPIYGIPLQENMQFCMKSGFDAHATKAVTPFYTYLGGFAGTLSTMLTSINSVKMTFATIVGSTTTVFSEFSGRIKRLFYGIQYTAIRMKFMMSRMSAVSNSIVYMGLAGIRAASNFMNGQIWGLMMFFCFPPETPILVLKGGEYVSVPIQSVEIGDILLNKERVTSVFSFNADGHDMVELPGKIQVSTNHFLLHNGKWIQAGDHPLAQPVGKWSGGNSRPLICLNTTTNSFQVGSYIFRDFDETSEGDEEAMKQVMEMLNGMSVSVPAAAVANQEIDNCMGCISCMACYEDTNIKLKNGSAIPAKQITLGEELSHGIVRGIVKKATTAICEYKGSIFAPGTAVWCEKGLKYERVSTLVPTIELDKEKVFFSFIVSPSAVIETSSGIIFRDYVEIHDSRLELPYSCALQKEEAGLEC